MSWREAIEPDWFHEAPFYLATIIAHGALLSLNPAMRWGSGPMPEKAVPVEFVAEIPAPPEPAPMPELAPPEPAPGGPGDDGAPKHGAGPLEREKVKRGAEDPPPKPKPVPKPAAVKSKVNKRGATVVKARAAPPPKPAVKAAPDPQAVRFAREAQAEARRLRAARDEEARASALAEKARKVEVARALAYERAERQRARDEARAAAAAAERERRAALAREEAERKAEAVRRAQAAKAAKAAKRAELSQALATMDDPDEALDSGPAPAPSGRGSARKGRPRAGRPPAGAGGDAFGGDEASTPAGDGAGGDGAELAGARKASAAAALAESTDPGDEAGSGGGDRIDAKPRGGGEGPEGGGVSWSVDGPVGNRRLISRVSPQSPDWVATRSLDLTVTVRFQVLPDGGVKPGAVIQKTSGFPDIDRRALEALRRWRFQPIPAKSGASEVWGRVTFRFTS